MRRQATTNTHNIRTCEVHMSGPVWFFPGIFDCQSTRTQWNLSNWKSYKLKAILSTLCIYAWICADANMCACVCMCVRVLCTWRGEWFYCFSALPAFANFLIPFWHGKSIHFFVRSVHMSLFALPDSVAIVDKISLTRMHRGVCDAQHKTESIRWHIIVYPNIHVDCWAP